MASLVDSVKDIFTDRYSFLKVLVFAIAANYDYSLYLNSKNDPTSFTLMTGIILFFIFGFVIKITGNIINEETKILPSLNPLSLGFTSIKGVLALLPAILIAGGLANFICSMINILPWFDYLIKTMIWLVAATVILTSYVMFTTKEVILDAFKLSVLVEKAGDILASIIGFGIQFALVNLITTGFVGYTIIVLFGFGPIFNFAMAIALIYNVCAAGHYAGQLYYENVKYGQS